MSSAIQPPIINIMEKVARKASKGMIRDFGELEKLQVSSKSIGNFVTKSDINAEKSILEDLINYYPDYSFLMEESGIIEGKDKDNTFVIDPIDGTSNFIHGIPHFSIVISKLTLNEITDGIIFNPITNEFYWCSSGKGSWLNNQRIRVSNRKDLEKCLIGIGSPKNSEENKQYVNQLEKIKKSHSNIRRFGSASLDLAYVASGKIDAFWENNLNLWDVASGVLLVLEAGGKITQPDGSIWQKNSKNIMASNNLIHEKIIDILNKH